MAVMTSKGKVRFLPVEVTTGLELVFLRVTTLGASKCPDIIALLLESFQLCRNQRDILFVKK
jgi:hypothetical protein